MNQSGNKPENGKKYPKISFFESIEPIKYHGCVQGTMKLPSEIFGVSGRPDQNGMYYRLENGMYHVTLCPNARAFFKEVNMNQFEDVGFDPDVLEFIHIEYEDGSTWTTGWNDGHAPRQHVKSAVYIDGYGVMVGFNATPIYDGWTYSLETN